MPTAGTQVTQGTTRVDTGVVGQGTGLTFGRGGTGGETDLRNFCCPAYLELLLERVGENWMRNQPERGTATIRFTVHRDGTITGITVQQTSGFGVLDRASRSAVSGVRLPPLPAEYTFDRLTVNLQFPYGGS
jgi:TonB family protein